jgi:hypothetical protein
VEVRKAREVILDEEFMVCVLGVVFEAVAWVVSGSHSLLRAMRS